MFCIWKKSEKKQNYFSESEIDFLKKVHKDEFKTIIARGMNTYDRASDNAKDFVDVLFFGKTLRK